MSTLPLPPRARIGVFAPSGIFEPKRLETGLETIRGWGLVPVLAPNLGKRHRYLAGRDEARLADLVWALSHPDLDAAWLARGGYGLTRLLPRIPWDQLPQRPVIGFSDASALFSALWRLGRPCAVHGPVLQSLADHADSRSRRALKALLLQGAGACWRGRAILPGSVRGPLIGGNLCTLASGAGTAHSLRSRGCILLLEDIGEPPYRLDRLLTQLLASGALEGVAGLALGSFVGCHGSGDPELAAADLLAGDLADLAIPLLADLPVGHGPQNHAFPWGVDAEIRDDSLSWSLTGAD